MGAGRRDQGRRSAAGPARGLVPAAAARHCSFMSVTIDVVPFGGWARNLRLRNEAAELLITLEVGPRILHFARRGGPSVLHRSERDAGGAGEAEFKGRGGHRLWLGPEAVPFTYFPDNRPVACEVLGEGLVRVTAPPEETTGFQKEIDVALDEAAPRVTLVHRVYNREARPQLVAPWALSVMAPGGLAIVPQPPLGAHPRDLLPDRRLVLWPYTDLSDARIRLGRRFFTLRQEPGRPPAKLGLLHQEGWVAYLLQRTLFVKWLPCDPLATYPDLGCNCELFTDGEMLEVESLGPLRTLQPGEAVEHGERWELYDDVAVGEGADEEALAAALAPLLLRRE